MQPVRLGANQPAARFYRGGARIAAFRGAAATSDRTPEDWVGSTVTLFGDPEVGVTWLTDGRRLADAIHDDPVSWLGSEHVDAYGEDVALLVKLLDAGERLPVHVHPDVAFSRDLLGLAHGKTEAWVLIEPAIVHLGFRREVEADLLSAWVRTQDTEAMLAAMNRLELAAGTTVLVPAGMPHAIGAGAFLVELQEPTDLSILLEWDGFQIDGPRDGHLGLGFERALDAVDLSRWDATRIQEVVVGPEVLGRLLPPRADPFFRVERHAITASADLEAGYSVLVITDGRGSIGDAHGHRLDVRRGDTLLTPHSAGSLRIDGRLVMLRCRPPAPDQARA